MKYDKKKAIDILVHAAQNYQTYLQDKTFLILYQNAKQTDYVQIAFKGNNFLHLTGVKTSLSAPHFFEKCLNQKLSPTEFELDPHGKALQKLSVLPYLHELPYHNCMIGNFINSGIYIKADYFVGNTRAILSVGFRHGKKADFPVTLYKEDVRKLSSPTNKVLAIFVKESLQQIYTTCTYLSKGQELQQLPIPEDLNPSIQFSSL